MDSNKEIIQELRSMKTELLDEVRKRNSDTVREVVEAIAPLWDSIAKTNKEVEILKKDIHELRRVVYDKAI